MKVAVRCLAVSLLFHSALFVSPSCGGGSGSDGGNQDGDGTGSVNITIIDKPDTGPVGENLCPSGFGGIGISYNPFDETVITDVYAGYPAFRIGIKAGDTVVGDVHAIRGEPGTPVSVRVMRNGKALVFDMTRERICTVDP